MSNLCIVPIFKTKSVHRIQEILSYEKKNPTVHSLKLADACDVSLVCSIIDWFDICKEYGAH